MKAIFETFAAATVAVVALLPQMAMGTIWYVDQDLAGNPRFYKDKIDIGCFERGKLSGLVVICR